MRAERVLGVRLVRNLEEFRSPNTGIHSSGWKEALQAFHDLIRRVNPDPMRTATITYTDDRTLAGATPGQGGRSS